MFSGFLGSPPSMALMSWPRRGSDFALFQTESEVSFLLPCWHILRAQLRPSSVDAPALSQPVRSTAASLHHGSCHHRLFSWCDIPDGRTHRLSSGSRASRVAIAPEGAALREPLHSAHCRSLTSPGPNSQFSSPRKCTLLFCNIHEKQLLLNFLKISSLYRCFSSARLRMQLRPSMG